MVIKRNSQKLLISWFLSSAAWRNVWGSSRGGILSRSVGGGLLVWLVGHGGGGWNINISGWSGGSDSFVWTSSSRGCSGSGWSLISLGGSSWSCIGGSNSWTFIDSGGSWGLVVLISIGGSLWLVWRRGGGGWLLLSWGGGDVGSSGGW